MGSADRVQRLLGNRYELRGVLGRGGMAEVREGWDTRLSRPVAIKLLYPALAADADLRERFEREARAAAALTHPHVVAVHDCGEEAGTPYIVMERLSGATLADEIASGPLRQERVVELLDQILSALTAAHAAGIVHRDIKPGNILIGHTGQAKLADFGIAKTDGVPRTQAGQILGTMAYLSPQRVTGQPAGVADDLYAVGVVGYEALTGRRPFERDNPAAMVRAILDDVPEPIASVRPDVAPGLISVIERAMAREVAFRFNDAATMRAALTGAEPPTARVDRPPTKVLTAPLPPIPPPPVLPSPRHWRVRLLLGVVGVVATLILVLVLALSRGSSGLTDTPATEPPPPTTSAVVPAPVTSAPVAVPEEPEEPGPGKGKGKEKKKEHGPKGPKGNPHA
ncbi:serine/threonine-protein kinase [Mycolicibacterium goodii]|uniref:non-specific serine/threonine protein kinase n=1 Tax=Mycolicibacterium goodii TaxID=134601 RepID=A0ABS6HNU0_MYCGD|nr:serine/threonine-protein kinase [Mycolicibacterium goodii]MBU8824372.1 serine/threonine protein kinase [Mycolicibacterium goodii]MBU8827950.1 serine/threonine protein kinase [Mycolicibacterium goodii]MBU8837552.1 serine/threonine protein kinase [Mycolicibacterium goodii]ULN47252.1 serine/threonine protein kinase [Mycolicibacterium goodii]